MKKSVKSNMYTNILEETWELFVSYLYGQKSGLIVVVSSRRLNDQATTALQNSFAQLGYGKEACTFVVLQGLINSSSKPSQISALLPILSEKTLLAVLEGLDPLFLVITDTEASDVCSKAYRQAIVPHERNRVFGREVRSFQFFESMLEDPREKQKAWALLKALPKLIV